MVLPRVRQEVQDQTVKNGEHFFFSAEDMMCVVCLSVGAVIPMLMFEIPWESQKYAVHGLKIYIRVSKNASFLSPVDFPIRFLMFFKGANIFIHLPILVENACIVHMRGHWSCT